VTDLDTGTGSAMENVTSTRRPLSTAGDKYPGIIASCDNRLVWLRILPTQAAIFLPMADHVIYGEFRLP